MLESAAVDELDKWWDLLGELAQLRKEFFWPLAGELQVEGIRAKIDLIVPHQLTAGANVNPLECFVIIPEGKDALAN